MQSVSRSLIIPIAALVTRHQRRISTFSTVLYNIFTFPLFASAITFLIMICSAPQHSSVSIRHDSSPPL